MKTWKQGQVAKVKTPDYVRDNIHVDLLSAVYVKFVAGIASSSGGTVKANPSGYCGTQGAFASKVANEVQARTGWPCALDLMTQEDFNEPLERTNNQPAVQALPNWNERAAWDAFVAYYAEN
jgi:hypothetical protein